MTSTKQYVDAKIKQKPVVVFSKAYVPECKAIKTMLADYGLTKDKLEYVEIECRQDCSKIENYLQILCLTDNREVCSQLYEFVKNINSAMHDILIIEY